MTSTAVPAVSDRPLDAGRAASRRAMSDTAATMPGIAAWGLVTGMAMVKSGLTAWQSLGMTFIVFGGSAQLAALPLIAAHSPPMLIFLTALMVNLRFVIFGAALAPHFVHLPWFRRLWYGYFTSDVTMAYFPQRYPLPGREPDGGVGYFAGIGYLNWIVWQIASVAGILLAGWIPDAWGIGFAGSLALLAVMIPLIVNLPALAGVVVAAGVGVLAYRLPYRLGLLLAIVLGMGAALAADVLVEKLGGKGDGATRAEKAPKTAGTEKAAEAAKVAARLGEQE